MARRITVEFLGKDKSASKTATAVEQRFGKLGGRLDKVGQTAGKVLAGGLLTGGALMIKFGNQASDLAETQSKVNQIFGKDGAESLDTFASAAAKNLGQSKQTALDAASTFGVFGKSANLAGDDLVNFSTDMTTLASDMASFNNTSPEEAIEAIGAALRGESEPIRKYGVLLDDATLRSEAMRMGLIKTTKQALTPQQKVLAAQSAILKQTKDQQGDFARTSDGLANKQRILKAQLTNVTTELGAKALPAMIKVTDVGLQMISWADRNRTTLGILVGVLGGFAGVLWTVSAAMRVYIAVTKAWRVIAIVARNAQFALNVAMATNPIGLVIVALVALGAVLVVAYKKSSTFRRIVDAAFRAVQKAAAFAFGWIKSHWPLIVAILTGPIGVAALIIIRKWDSIRNGASRMVDWIRAVPGKLRALGGLFASAGRHLITSFINGLSNAGSFVSNIAGNISGAIRGMLNAAIDRINSALSINIDWPGPGSFHWRASIPHLARGTTSAAGGMTLVGEEGPELVNMRRGAQVLNNRRTRGLLGGGSGQPLLVQFLLDGRVVEQALIKRQRDTGRPIQIRVAST